MRAAVALLCLCLLAFGIAPTSSYHGKSAVIHDGSSLSAPTDFDGRLDHRELTALGLRSESRCNFDADTYASRSQVYRGILSLLTHMIRNELLDDVERMPNLRSTCFRHRLTAFAKTAILVTGEIGLAFFALVAFLVTVTYLWPDRHVYSSVSDNATANQVRRIKRATTLDSHTVHSMVSRSESRDK
jgi:hypothetical protein